MNEVSRCDIGSMGAVERMENGWLRVPGRFTRIGVFVYQDARGGVRRELRLPEEVFHPDALRSFALVPVTVQHPPEMLNKDNAKEYQVGSTGENIVRDGDHVSGSVMVTDARGIDAIEKEGLRELSCGYSCLLETKSGSWNGLAYDAIQRQIRGNHLAIVDRGRAGPTAKLQMDRFDAVQMDASVEREEMKKFLINGVWVELSDQAASAYEAEQKANKDRIDALSQENTKLKSEAEKAKAREDSLREDLDKEKKARTDAEKPERIRDAIKSRLSLEKVAAKVLPKDTKLDALSDKEIKAKVVIAKYPSAKLDGVSEEYLNARFDTVVEQLSENKEDSRIDHLNETSSTDRREIRSDEPDEIRKKTIKEEGERSKKTLRG